MLALIPILILAQQPAARLSRAAFHEACVKLGENPTKAQVLKALGKPDKIILHSQNMAADEEWLYGTTHTDLTSTLATIDFSHGKALFITGAYGTPPSPKVISESELAQSIRALGKLNYRSTPIEYIRAANAMIPLEQTKALAAMVEYSRLHSFDMNEAMFWLVRVAFVPAKKGGYFAIPYIGQISPPPPKNLSSWPTYPVTFIDGIPFISDVGVSLAGEAEGFEYYAERDSKNWAIRTQPIVPPDDPFPACEKMILGSPNPLRQSKDVLSYMVLEQALALVSSAFRPHIEDGTYSNVAMYHAKYLKLHCHWDKAREMYVRPDGSSFPPEKKRP